MTIEFFARFVFSAIIGLSLAWTVFSKYDDEVGEESEGGSVKRCQPLVHGALLPTVLLALLLLGLKFYGTDLTLKMVLTMCFDIFLQISLYYMILIPLLPLLRKWISARACAMLWLIPNYLYMTQQSYMQISRPLLTLHVSSKLIAVLSSIWMIGFLSVLLWNIISHLLFRKKILANAAPVTDNDVLSIFHDKLEEAGIRKPKLQLVTSEEVSTPLTIGLFKRSTRIILPRANYSDDDLKLIFRHELVHINREDSWAKFFLVFCTAMCWFNPLMWIAMKKSAEDMELSCDETVLLDADSHTRTRYANLILCTSGNDRGFSTCLSASASSMRYRLKAIVKPRKIHSGALIVGLTFFLLCMTCGYVSLAYGEDTGTATIFRSHDLTEFSADDITVSGGDYVNGVDNIDAAALTQYIASLPTQEMTGNYSYSDEEKELSIWYNSPYGIVLVDLHTDFIKVIYLKDETDAWYVYHLPEPTDWEYIDSIVPPLPEAEVSLSDGTQYGGSHLKAAVIKLVRKSNDDAIVFRDREIQPYEGAGVYGSKTYTDAVITFSMQPVSEVEVLIENWDYSTGYTLTFDSADTVTFKMPDYPAHFTVTGSFQGSNGVYDTTFIFRVGDMDSI